MLRAASALGAAVRSSPARALPRGLARALARTPRARGLARDAAARHSAAGARRGGGGDMPHPSAVARAMRESADPLGTWSELRAACHARHLTGALASLARAPADTQQRALADPRLCELLETLGRALEGRSAASKRRLGPRDLAMAAHAISRISALGADGGAKHSPRAAVSSSAAGEAPGALASRARSEAEGAYVGMAADDLLSPLPAGGAGGGVGSTGGGGGGEGGSAQPSGAADTPPGGGCALASSRALELIGEASLPLIESGAFPPSALAMLAWAYARAAPTPACARAVLRAASIAAAPSADALDGRDVSSMAWAYARLGVPAPALFDGLAAAAAARPHTYKPHHLVGAAWAFACARPQSGPSALRALAPAAEAAAAAGALSPGQQATLAYAYATAGVPAPRLFELLARSGSRAHCASRMTRAELARALWAHGRAAELSGAAPDSGLMRALGLAATRRAHEMLGGVELPRALGGLEHGAEPAAEAAAGSARAAACREPPAMRTTSAPPARGAALGGADAAARAEPAAALAALSAAADAHVTRLPPRQLADVGCALALARACAPADARTRGLFSALARAARARAPSATPSDNVRLAWAFAHARVSAPALFGEIAASLADELVASPAAAARRADEARGEIAISAEARGEIPISAARARSAPERAGAGLRALRPDELATAAWAFAKAGVVPPALFSALGRALATRAHELSARDVGRVLWAFASAAQPAPALFCAMAAEAEARAGEFDLASAAAALWGLALRTGGMDPRHNGGARHLWARVRALRPAPAAARSRPGARVPGADVCDTGGGGGGGVDVSAELALRQAALSAYLHRLCLHTPLALPAEAMECFAPGGDGGGGGGGEGGGGGGAETEGGGARPPQRSAPAGPAWAPRRRRLLPAGAGAWRHGARAPRVSKAQRALSRALHARGWEHVAELPLGGGLLTPDLACPATRVAVEMDGRSHWLQDPSGPAAAGRRAGCTAQQQPWQLNGASQWKARMLRLLGWRVVRVSHEEWRRNPERLTREVLGAVRAAAAQQPLPPRQPSYRRLLGTDAASRAAAAGSAAHAVAAAAAAGSEAARTPDTARGQASGDEAEDGRAAAAALPPPSGSAAAAAAAAAPAAPAGGPPPSGSSRVGSRGGGDDDDDFTTSSSTAGPGPPAP